MKQVRLLPIVIFAALALLLFKGVGLLTSGGYVLTGTTQAVAAGGGEGAPAGGEVTMTLPAEPTLKDEAPVIDDHAPTLATKEEAPAGHGEPAAEGAPDPHADPSANPEAPAGATPPAGAADPAHGEAAAPAVPDATAPAPDAHATNTASAADPNCAVAAAPAEPAAGDHSAPAAAPCADPGVDPRAEGIPMIKTGEGAATPLGTNDGTEKALLARLAERRAELDTRDAELQMRAVLLEAAEKRLDERKAELEALEARINALVEEKKAMEDGEFKSVVGMYENMKAAEAAPIFNQLPMNVLMRLARTISPRKMSPILAKMDPARAQELTTMMAAAQAEPTIDVASPDIASLPQIVGQ